MAIVVVGAGLAGTRTVAALRELGSREHIILIGNEGVPGYDRPPLSKHLMNRTEPVWLSEDLGADVHSLADEVWLYRHALGLTLEPDAAVVHTDDGDIPAEVVVAASGSRVDVPPELDGVAVLRTLRDAQYLRERIGPGRHIVIAGAGWVGTELASTATTAGARVTVVEGGPTPLHTYFPRSVGSRLARWMTRAGVEFLAGSWLTRVERHADRRIAHIQDAAKGSHTTIDCDLIVAATGVRPATDWLQDTGVLNADGFVPVTAYQQAAPRLFAVGDITERTSARFGVLRGGHWDNALRAPEVAARAITRASMPASLNDPVPYVFSQQFGHALALLGRPRPHFEVVEVNMDDGWLAAWVHEGLLQAVLLVDAPQQIGPARRLLGGPELPAVDLEHADQATSLTELLR